MTELTNQLEDSEAHHRLRETQLRAQYEGEVHSIKVGAERAAVVHCVVPTNAVCLVRQESFGTQHAVLQEKHSQLVHEHSGCEERLAAAKADFDDVVPSEALYKVRARSDRVGIGRLNTLCLCVVINRS